MGQNTFGKRYAVALQGAGKRDATARATAGTDERLRLGLLIAMGIVTGFVIAAIECL